jgi:hypothetical protein
MTGATRRVAAGSAVDINVVDHVILGDAMLQLQGIGTTVSRVLYFDCFSGISGDMALGALLDAGLPLDELTRALGSLALGGVHIHADRVLRAGVSATKFKVHDHGDGHGHHHHDHHHEHAAPGGDHNRAHRSLPEIFALIDNAAMPIIGDPITLIAGLLKENFVRFLLMVSLAKVGRYVFIYWAFSMF